MNKALAFDDVLLTPGFSIVRSRENVNLETKFLSYYFKVPIISSNMSTVTGFLMAQLMTQIGGLGILHRMQSIEDQCDQVKELKRKFPEWPIAASIEANTDGHYRAKALIDSGCNILCVDVAYAYSELMLEFLKILITKYPVKPLIVGNIATMEAAKGIKAHLTNHDLWHDNIAFKIGVGSGSMCTTRVVTGHGLPTFASLQTFDKNHDFELIADGGIKNSGDIVKSFAAGATMVMLGSLLSGTTECPGDVIMFQNKKYKIYRGSASFGQKNETIKDPKFIEGVEHLVPYKGSALSVLQQLIEGIKSGCSYAGVNKIKDFVNGGYESRFVEITNSGLRESLPHGTI